MSQFKLYSYRWICLNLGDNWGVSRDTEIGISCIIIASNKTEADKLFLSQEENQQNIKMGRINHLILLCETYSLREKLVVRTQKVINCMMSHPCYVNKLFAEKTKAERVEVLEYPYFPQDQVVWPKKGDEKR